MEIEFDPDKEALNRARHKMGFAGSETIFDGFRSTMRTTGKIMAKRGS